MSIPKENTRGGFHFGNVGGGANINAGGDVVGGDKTTTTTITKGIADDEEIKQLRAEVAGSLQPKSN